MKQQVHMASAVPRLESLEQLEDVGQQFILVRANEAVENGLRCGKVLNDGRAKKHVKCPHNCVLGVLFSNENGERPYCIHQGWRMTLKMC